MATAEQVQALLDRIQNLETQIISAGVAAKGAGKGRVGPGLGVDTRALGRPSTFRRPGCQMERLVGRVQVVCRLG